MKNHGFKRKYVYGGAGIFDSLAKLFTSGVAKQLTSTAIDVGKEVGKKTAIDVCTKLVKKVLTPKAPGAVATEVQNILNKYVAPKLPVRQNIVMVKSHLLLPEHLQIQQLEINIICFSVGNP